MSCSRNNSRASNETATEKNALQPELSRRGCVRARIKRLLWISSFALFISVAASAGDVEYQVKGGYLYNFTKFVEWPPNAFSSSTAPIVIGILGDDPFGAQFEEAMQGQMSHGRPIKVEHIRRAEDASGCHVLFVSHSAAGFLPEILKRAPNVLTVGENGGFARQGGVIEFLIVDGKVRFIINVDAEKRSGLKISSHLKQVAADIVHE